MPTCVERPLQEYSASEWHEEVPSAFKMLFPHLESKVVKSAIVVLKQGWCFHEKCFQEFTFCPCVTFPPWVLEFRSLREFSPGSSPPEFLVVRGCGPWTHPGKRSWGLQSAAVSWLWCCRSVSDLLSWTCHCHMTGLDIKNRPHLLSLSQMRLPRPCG